MKSTIITIGDEILIGQILDTNSRYISQALNRIGVVVAERTSIGDNAAQIIETLDRALAATDIVIITGGLGPTKDDITKHTLAKYFDSELVYNECVGEAVEKLLAARGIAFTDLNRGQAMVPRCCTVLHNYHGTAPGMWFERDGKVVISLPGVPFEMVHLIDDSVIPMLRNRFDLKAIVHKTMITSGIAESILAGKRACLRCYISPTCRHQISSDYAFRHTRLTERASKDLLTRSSSSCDKLSRRRLSALRMQQLSNLSIISLSSVAKHSQLPRAARAELSPRSLPL